MADLSLEFVKANPCGNTTIFVLSPVEREKYAKVAELLMGDGVLCAEQTGFVERVSGGSRLEMAAGEFCGNASRSYAAWLLMGGREYLAHGGETLKPLKQPKACLQVEVSGAGRPLLARIEDIGSDFGCFAEIGMPEPEKIISGKDAALGEYSIVKFSGITHGVLWEKTADAELMAVFRRLIRKLGMDSICCGLMFVERSEPLFIRPFVYTSGVESFVWEQSCGSGSLAVLCAKADTERKSFRRLPVGQPGGVLKLSCDFNGEGINHTLLAGSVYFTARGVAHVENV